MKKILTMLFVISSFMVFAQQRTITGKVTDESKEGIPGVNVSIKGTTTGVITDFDGNYSIKAETGNTLFYSFIGMDSREVVVGSSNTMNVILQSSVTEIEEVVAVGYGSVKKSDLTGSVASIKSDDVAKMGSISIDQALSGKASGVVVNQGSGVPGSGASIKIRGVNSMMGSEPLYIIDGVPVDNTSLSSMTNESEAGGNISPLSTINPSDIESMEILKDASATAIYGSRGANGVIIITTKSGKSGKGKISVDAEYGISQLPNKIDIQDANEYWLSRYEGQFNANSLSDDFNMAVLDSARAGLYETTDWQDAVFRQGSSQNYNLNFSGGKDGVRYLVSSNLFDAQGIVENSDFNRISTRVNLDAKLNDHVDVGTRMYYATINSTQQSTTTNFQTNNGTNSIIMRALVTSPVAKLDASYDDEGVEYYTPLQALDANNYENLISQFLGNMFIKLKLSKGLTFKTDFSYQIRSTNQRFYQKNVLPQAYSKGGWAKTNDSRVRVYTNTNTLSYLKTLKKVHRINAVLGQSTEWFDHTAVITSNYGFANDLLEYYAPQTAQFMDPDIVQYSDSRLVSYFGRINYTYNDKLLLTFTGRADGSSKFADNNKFAFFPAGAIGYRLSEEPFIKDIEKISNIKLRASYGISGNQAIQPYQSLDQLASNKHSFGDGAGGETYSTIFYQSQLPNSDLRWETTAQANLGVDLGLIDNRYTVTFDYYKKQTDDLLVVGNRIPSQSGFSTFTENLGKMESDGFELGINAHIVDNEDFSWNVGATFSTGKTKIKEMGEDYFPSGYNQGWVSGGTQRLIIGEELGAFYGYKTAGISQFNDFAEFQGLTDQERIDLYNADPMAVFTPVLDDDGVGVIANRPGEQLYEDVAQPIYNEEGEIIGYEKDGLIDEKDKQIIGYAQPDLMFGFNNTIQYKNFELSFFIDGQFGQDVTNVMNFRLLGFDDKQQLAEVRNRWTPENPSNEYPRLDALNTGASAFTYSDRFIEDASFVRLQNVTLSYNLPKSMTRKLKLQGAKVYVSGSNLYTISDYSGFSPDVSLTGNNTQKMGHDNAGYPVARTFRIGVNLKL